MLLFKKFICVGLSAVMMLSFAGCNKKEEEAVSANATNVTVAAAAEKDVSNIVTYTGELKAAESAIVSSKIAAKIKTIHVDIGDYVEAGTVLATLDGADYQNAYNQALAAYNNVANGSSEQSKISVNQTLANAQTAYDNALDEYNRQKQLYDIGAISEVAFNACKTQLDTAKLNLDSAKQNYNLTVDVVAPGNVASAKAALDTAKTNLANTSITAPISGYVASNNAKIGMMAAAGVELFSIANSKSVDAEVNVTESVIPYIEVGTKAAISVKSASIDNIEGAVTVVNPVKNAATGMYTARVSIPNNDGKLMVGMMADITLTTDVAVSAVAIPSEALLEDSEGNTYVYVAEGNKAVRKDVQIGISDTKNTQIISGIKSGDNVVVTGKEYISEKNNDINIISEK